MRIPRNGMDPSPSLRPCSAEDQNEGVEPTHLIEEDRSMNEITILAIDLAKSVFVRPESRLSFCFTGGFIT